MNKIYLIFVLLFFVLGCNNQNVNNQFVIEFEFFSKTNDSIHVYYTTNKSINFNENQSIWVDIIAQKNNQKKVIYLPKNQLIKQIRIDFGHNSKSQEVVLNKMNFSFNNQNVTFKGKEIYEVFRIDDTNTVLDKSIGLLKRKYNNQKAVFSLYPKGDKLFNRLNQLYSEK